jgi:MOSC domain-containing protein YiiM
MGGIGVVKAVCVSNKKGESKKNIKSARFIPDWGVENDAHGGKGRRQVSLLMYEKVQQFNESGTDSCVPNAGHGDFGENLVIEGLDLGSLPVGTLLKCSEVELEITQIGKECHNFCQIYHTMGDCIMPREGVFARVLKEGVVTVGETMEVADAAI